MHEFALAEAVITAALETADKEGLSEITRIEVRIGELQQIERETFEFALKELMPASHARLSATRIDLEIEPARFRCRACRHGFALGDSALPREDNDREAIHFIPELAHGFLRCPGCRSPDFEVLEGRGVTIARIEGEQP